MPSMATNNRAYLLSDPRYDNRIAGALGTGYFELGATPTLNLTKQLVLPSPG